MKFLEREFPSWVPRYEQLYAKKYAPLDYRKQVQGMVRALQERYGLNKRREADTELRPQPPPTNPNRLGSPGEHFMAAAVAYGRGDPPAP